MTVAYVSLGSNLGDRDSYLAAGRRLLAEGGAALARESPVVETKPVGVVDQPDFLNQVVEVEWIGTARELLTLLKDIERMAGRTIRERWGPRELDLDILLFGDEVIDEPDLHVPHRELANRPFFAEPLAAWGISPSRS